MSSLAALLGILEDSWEDTVTLSRHDFLVVEGETATPLYLVLDWSLRVFIENEKEQHNIRFGYKNSIITALDAFISIEPTSFYIQAIKKCSLKMMYKLTFEKLVNLNTTHKEIWNSVLKEFVGQQLEREIDLITYAPKMRHRRVLKRSPQVFQEIPYKHIASYLRLSPETLSRIMKNLD